MGIAQNFMQQVRRIVLGYIHSATAPVDLDRCAECGKPVGNRDFVYRDAYAFCSEQHFLEGVSARAA